MKIFSTLSLLIFIFIGAVFFASPVPSHANHTDAHSIEQLQQQILDLLKIVTSLQTQLAQQIDGRDGTTDPVPAEGVCPVFAYNFYLGSRDRETEGQVTRLQKFLARDSSIYPEAQITGFFGPLTEQAVKRWQESHDVVSSGSPETTGYGVVGPKTRSAIRNACVSAPPIHVPPATPILCTTDIKICSDGSSVGRESPTCEFKACPSVFPPDQDNLPPTIHSVSGPTVLKAGEQGTWKVSASDPEDGSLSYSVSWGDGVRVGEGGSALLSETIVQQNATFTHSYANAGTYTPTFTVSDSKGQTVKTSISVKVENARVPSITVLSPNGGEQITPFVSQDTTPGGGTVITWSSENLAPDSRTHVHLALISENLGEMGWINTTDSCFSYVLYANEKYVWKGDTVCRGSEKVVVQPGRYKIKARLYLENYPQPARLIASDLSDTWFTIKSDMSETSSIEVLSPNGGEVWKNDTTQIIMWKALNLPSVADNSVSISLVKIENNKDVRIIGLFPSTPTGTGAVFNDGAESATIPASIEPGFYKIRINAACKTPVTDPVCFGLFDDSDAPFTITSGIQSDITAYIESQDGRTVTINGSAVNPLGHLLTWDWGDNSITQLSSFPATHTYKVDGEYTVRISLLDANGRTQLAEVKVSAYEVVKERTWSVSRAPSSPIGKIVSAGSMGVVLDVFRFAGTTEELAVTDLYFELKAPASAADITKIYLYDGTTLLQSIVPIFVNGVQRFIFPLYGTGSFKIPKDGWNEIVVKADISGIGYRLPGTAGQEIIIGYDGQSNNKAVGMSSGQSVLSSTKSDIFGNGIRYYKGIPQIARVAIPSTQLTSGNHVLYKFTVASTGGDVAIHKFSFKIAHSGITPFNQAYGNFTLWNTTNNTRVSKAVGTTASYYSEPGRYNSDGSLNVEIIADTTDNAYPWATIAGLSHTFELHADITTDGSPGSVSTKLLGDAGYPEGIDRMANVSQIMAAGPSNNFIWSDFSSDATTTHGVYTADWTNGYNVHGLLSTGLDSSTLSASASDVIKSDTGFASSQDTQALALLLVSIQEQINALARSISAYVNQ